MQLLQCMQTWRAKLESSRLCSEEQSTQSPKIRSSTWRVHCNTCRGSSSWWFSPIDIVDNDFFEIIRTWKQNKNLFFNATVMLFQMNGAARKSQQENPPHQLNITHFFIKDCIDKEHATGKHCPTADMIGWHNKPLHDRKFEKHKALVIGHKPSPTWCVSPDWTTQVCWNTICNLNLQLKTRPDLKN